MTRKKSTDTGKASKSGPGSRKADSAKSSKPTTARKSENVAGPQQQVPETDYDKSNALAIVGIGASAGGLEALKEFFSHCPADMGVGFVVVQHLAPNRSTVMDSLLSKFTSMNVVKISDGMTVEPDTVYLNRPGRDLTIVGGTLCLIERESGPASHSSIDVFFRALAQDQQKKAVCIVLSGTGSDGTQGIKAVKEAGGLVLAQEPSEAAHQGMPASAIGTGLVDFVLPAKEMPEKILTYKSHPYLQPASKQARAGEATEVSLKKVISMVRKVTGRDLSQYKPNTLLRRIQRRMALQQIDAIADYVRYLGKNPSEVGQLFEDTLITVTSFFRDQQAFEALGAEIKRLVQQKPANGVLRIWIPGCGSGEEAYSIAILVVEAMREARKHLDVQIFATDLSSAAIEKARAGKYPASIALDLTAERLNENFSKTQDCYRIRKHIREMIIFSVHDLAKDPPFSRIDLISCRNVLIYMTGELQRRVLQLLHFVLNENGCLFLGTSETVGPLAEHFSMINAKWKLFKRQPAPFGGRRLLPNVGGIHYPAQPATASEASDMRSADVSYIAEKMLLGDFAPACALVDENYNVVYTHGVIEPFMALPAGEPSLNILKMVRPGIRDKLIKALHDAFSGRDPVKCSKLRVKHNNDVTDVNLILKKIPVGLAGNRRLVLTTFEGSSHEPGKKRSTRSSGSREDPRIGELETELASTRESLQTMLEELETNNEELKSTNEELQSTNEELQSTNEELETAREELQSANEELETSNSELQGRIDETAQANADLVNLLGNAEIGVLFLDTDFRIKRFTDSITNFFNLIETDVGRHIEDIAPKIDYGCLCADAKNVLKTLRRFETDVQASDGRWINICISPYRTLDNVIDGVTVVYRNIDLEVTSAEQLRHLRAVVADSNDAVTVLDPDGAIQVWNPAAEVIYGYSEDEAQKMNICEIIPDDQAPVWQHILDQVNKGQSVRRRPVTRLTRNGGTVEILLTATPLVDKEGNVIAIATTEHHTSKQHEAGSADC